MESVLNNPILEDSIPQIVKENLVVQEFNEETLVYDLKRNQAFCLNPTSAAVWRLCDGDKTINEINAGLSKQLNAPVSDELIWLALTQLESSNLIDFKKSSTPLPTNSHDLAELPRRTLIKRAAMTAVIALPVIASLAIPPAAAAQSASGLSEGETCQADAQCRSGCCLSNICEPAEACAV